MTLGQDVGSYLAGSPPSISDRNAPNKAHRKVLGRGSSGVCRSPALEAEGLCEGVVVGGFVRLMAVVKLVPLGKSWHS